MGRRGKELATERGKFTKKKGRAMTAAEAKKEWSHLSPKRKMKPDFDQEVAVPVRAKKDRSPQAPTGGRLPASGKKGENHIPLSTEK